MYFDFNAKEMEKKSVPRGIKSVSPVGGATDVPITTTIIIEFKNPFKWRIIMF